MIYKHPLYPRDLFYTDSAPLTSRLYSPPQITWLSAG
jgi:hypothetical protein